MLFFTIIKFGIKSLIANKLRSFLAMLGIIMGVGAVIAMLAIGSGAKKQVMDRFSSMGTNLLIVMPGQRGSRGVVTGGQQNLTLADALAVVKEIKGIGLVAPGVQSSGQIKYFNRNTRSAIFGTSPTYFSARTLEIEKGRIFTDEEVDRMGRVVVMGPVTAKRIFEGNDPINEMIKINGINFRVIGVTKPKGEGWMSPDDRVIVPYTTAMKQLFGVDYLREIDIQAKEEVDLDRIQADIRDLMRKRHRIQADMDDDFSITDMAEIRKNASESIGVFKWLLGGISGISLLVGGIGIMNIMLVTVTERTKEIGIRKAIGAEDRYILLQFLIESIIVSGFGGFFGVAFGVGMAKIIPHFGSFETIIEWPSIIMAFSVAGAVGVFFGYYPAWRAAQLDPIEALRNE